MGNRAHRKITRKDKINGAHLVACGKHIDGMYTRLGIKNGSKERRMDYNSLSPIGKAAIDNVVNLTGKSREEILGNATT